MAALPCCWPVSGIWVCGPTPHTFPKAQSLLSLSKVTHASLGARVHWAVNGATGKQISVVQHIMGL
eukprot:scaffold140491_cov21-Tisochrysis_lutea.AAC.1